MAIHPHGTLPHSDAGRNCWKFLVARRGRLNSTMYFRSVHSDVALAWENLPVPSVSFSGLSSCSRTISPGVLPAFHLFVISATTSLSSFCHLLVEAPQSTCDLPPGLRGTVNTPHVQSPSPWSRFFLSSWRTKPRVTRVHLHGAVSDWGSLEPRGRLPGQLENVRPFIQRR